MNVFEAVKQNVTTRQAAELYGISVSRNGMAVCPFHNDKNPSMKLDRRFHCFACQADGDAVDFVSRLFQLPSKEAAMKLADDFGIAYDSGQKPTVKPHIREPTPEQKYRQEEMHCYKVLCEYFHLLLYCALIGYIHYTGLSGTLHRQHGLLQTAFQGGAGPHL